MWMPMTSLNPEGLRSNEKVDSKKRDNFKDINELEKFSKKAEDQKTFLTRKKGRKPKSMRGLYHILIGIRK